MRRLLLRSGLRRGFLFPPALSPPAEKPPESGITRAPAWRFSSLSVGLVLFSVHRGRDSIDAIADCVNTRPGIV